MNLLNHNPVFEVSNNFPDSLQDAALHRQRGGVYANLSSSMRMDVYYYGHGGLRDGRVKENLPIEPFEALTGCGRCLDWGEYCFGTHRWKIRLDGGLRQIPEESGVSFSLKACSQKDLSSCPGFGKNLLLLRMQKNENSPGEAIVEGILEPQPNKAGQLINPLHNGRTRPDDPFVPRELIRRFKIQKGSWVTAKAHRDSRFPNPKVRFVETVDGLPVDERKQKVGFSQLTTITPDEWLQLETKDGAMTVRTIDMFCPIGKGQRGLIVAPPRTGKTIILRDIALGVLENNPECHVMILLVDERPEEVTDLKRSVPCEVYASSNDEAVSSHLRIAELAIERAKRLVEVGKDVVVLLDSLTRLARAHNSSRRTSGRTMTGGLDIRALEKPRQLFSAARNTEEAGSLTIMASALVETGSRMDDLIFQEFKGTGNMEMVLDRKVAELRIWPALNISSSGTRREELLLKPQMLDRCHFFRRALAGMKVDDAAETAISRLGKTENNAEFLNLITL